MAVANTQPHESALYYEFSHLYDLVFGRVFYPRIVRVIRSLGIEPGARVLEIGVGTGLALEAYPHHCQVTGIDLAPEMLERAQDRVNRNGWRHVTLAQGDALNLQFDDDAFDYVMAFHVVSVVPDPQRMMAEAQRVCRPGGLHRRSSTTSAARTGPSPACSAASIRSRAVSAGPPSSSPRSSIAPPCTSSGSGRRRRARCSRSSLRATRRQFRRRAGRPATRCSVTDRSTADQCRNVCPGATGITPRRTSRSASRSPRVWSQRL